MKHIFQYISIFCCAVVLFGCGGKCGECNRPPSNGYKTMFITSESHNAGFGGVTGADTFCQNKALSAHLNGTFKALLISSTRYPCDESGLCGIGHESDWPISANTGYANVGNPGVLIMISNSNMVFESSYTKNLILTENNTIESGRFWLGINGVKTGTLGMESTPASLVGWSYVDESTNWSGHWRYYDTWNCEDWTESGGAISSGQIGDNGSRPDSYFGDSGLSSNVGYSLSDLLEYATSTPSRWVGGEYEPAVSCDNFEHLICVQQ